VQFRPVPRILVAVTLSDRKYIRFLRCEFARTRSALASQANGRMMLIISADVELNPAPKIRPSG